VARALPVLALVLGLAGCSSGQAEFATARLPTLVLQPGDLGPDVSQFDYGRQVSADAHPGARGDPQRFGRLGGWISRYKRDGTAKTPGPLVVESRADLFPSPGAAGKDLDAYAEEYSALPGARELAEPHVGDEARAFEIRQGQLSYYLVAWRDSNATASVNVQGLSLTAGEAFALARKQQARINAAAG
jgi:hypothetical protein